MDETGLEITTYLQNYEEAQGDRRAGFSFGVKFLGGYTSDFGFLKFASFG